MIGPSSSHTAGAVRIGLVARAVSKSKAKSVKFYLHGSFRNTYQGHGTDRALAAGLMGMRTDDERIRHSLDIAKEKGICLEFIKADLGDVHPNTVKIEMLDESGNKTSVVASSIGGGEIRVYSINGLKMDSSCSYNTVIIEQVNDIDILSGVIDMIKKSGLAMHSLSSSQQRGDKNYYVTVLELNNSPAEIETFVEKLNLIKGVLKTTNINSV